MDSSGNFYLKGDAGGSLEWTAGTKTLAITGAITITGGSGIASLSDAGSLAVLDEVGASNIDTTVISDGKIITGLLTATNIQTGTLTGRTVQTAASGQRIVITGGAAGNIKFYKTGVVAPVLTIDDAIVATRPGISIGNATIGGVYQSFKDSKNFSNLYENGFSIYKRKNRGY